MNNIFAELIAFLFAQSRRDNPIPAAYSRRLLAGISNLIHTKEGKEYEE